MKLSESTTEENGVQFVDTKVVADFYGVTTETVRNWIKDGKISGKQLSGHRGKWFIPAEEFEYFKSQEEADDTEGNIKELLGENYTEDWDVELDEDK
ncbi:helix-turn-helix domain-containing protein [Niallia sp. 01092]|uniref:helix-turn-helix domain-containing protein n=1 Tax=unclassified Niallia TaxID=2837522 RepID=UPI003FCF9A74